MPAAARPTRAQKTRDVQARPPVKLDKRFVGQPPTDERLRKGIIEVLDAATIDLAVKGRAIRMGDGWRPQTFYNRGRLSKRQYLAACQLRSDYATGRFGVMRGSTWDTPRVDQSGPGVPEPERRVAAKRRYMEAISKLGRTSRAVVEAVVVHEETVEAASKLAALSCLVTDSATRARQISAMAFLGEGLNELAEHYGLK